MQSLLTFICHWVYCVCVCTWERGCVCGKTWWGEGDIFKNAFKVYIVNSVCIKVATLLMDEDERYIDSKPCWLIMSGPCNHTMSLLKCHHSNMWVKTCPVPLDILLGCTMATGIQFSCKTSDYLCFVFESAVHPQTSLQWLTEATFSAKVWTRSASCTMDPVLPSRYREGGHNSILHCVSPWQMCASDQIQ